MNETNLLDEKCAKEMKEVLFDTKKLISKHTDTIPSIETLKCMTKIIIVKILMDFLKKYIKYLLNLLNTIISF